MKLVTTFLALSAAANAALVFALVNRGPEQREVVVQKSQSSSTLTVEKQISAEQAEAAKELSSAVTRGDAAGVRDHLRALGLPEDVVRQAVRAVLFKPVTTLSREISQKQNGGAYWKGVSGALIPQALPKEERNRLREMQREANRQLEALLGPDPTDPANAKYAFLPPEKASKLREIESDYNELRAQLSGEVEGFRIPSDEEKMAYLQKEFRKDLEATLSPEELADYDRRNSSTASRLRWQLRGLDVSEDEYKTIFALTKSYEDQFEGGRRRGPAGYDGNEGNSQRAEAQRQLNEQLKAALGEQRFAEYQRSQDPDFNGLQAAARRFDLPTQAVSQAYAARDQAVAASQRIAADTTLTPEQRTSALTNLATQTKNQVKAALGPDVGDAYLRSNMRWLDAIERGQTISVNPNGSVSVTRDRNQPARGLPSGSLRSNNFPQLTPGG